MSSYILTPYKIDGVYNEIGTEQMYVPMDVLNHMYNPTTGLHEFLTDPIVIYRHLDMSIKEHKRYGILLSEFNIKFQKV